MAKQHERKRTRVSALVRLCKRFVEQPGAMLQAVSQILSELRGQSLLPIPDGGKAAKEKAQRGGLLDECQSADEVAVLVQPYNAVNGVFHLGKGEHAAG